MYAGNIEGRGPRYCPSIEDKIARFPQREEHHVFIEPEGEGVDEIYPAGLSTSLPVDVQEAYIRSIKGFENAIITKPGYAVEYDMVQPTNLHHSLESKHVRGLFFAGQVNGTTGYEEAASQGIIAGINAVLKVRNQEPFILSRSESYIGVMIDDLVTLGADEPYRMFTSRAERRLLLRQDNVFKRLMPYGYRLGLISEQVYAEFVAEQQLLDACVVLIRRFKHGHEIYQLFAGIDFDAPIMARAKELLIVRLLEEREQYERVLGRALDEHSLAAALHSRLLLGVHAEIKYAGYLDRELKEVEKAEKYQALQIPATLDYKSISGLSAEMQEKLLRYVPKTIAQAQLIPGMTPAAISILIFQIQMLKKGDYL
jgi:tRNA uridine 5-carboxymethylaminomethyl modification enzyme